MKADKIASVCIQYQYPHVVETWLRMCCDEFKFINPSSIVLIGSASRGELTLMEKAKKQELLSDLEFLIFLNRKLHKREYQNLIDRIEKLTALIPYTNPHFHIDFTLIPLPRAHRVSRNLATFEMRTLGKTLEGNDNNRLRLPEVSIKNLNFRALDQLVLVRLWWLLAGIPMSVVKGQSSEYADLLFSYIACRNLLDVPTILLPHEGHLIAGYKDRARFLEVHYTSLTAVKYMGVHFPGAVVQGLREKLNLEFQEKSLKGYLRTVDSYVRLIRYLLRDNPETEAWDLCERLISGRTLFDSSSLSRQRIRMIISGSIKKSRRPVLGYFHHLGLPIESILVATMVSMHQALSHMLQGHEKDAINWIKKASILLRRIDPKTRFLSTGSISDKWLYLRNEIYKMICGFYNKFGRRRKFIRDMLDWRG